MPRVRDYTRSDPSSYRISVDGISGSTTIPVVSAITTYHREDETTPNFRKRKRPANPPPTNRYRRHGSRQNFASGELSWWDTLYRNRRSGTLRMSELPGLEPDFTSWDPLGIISDLTVKAQNKVLSKIKDSKINAAQAIGERKQVEKLFVQNVTSVSRAIRSIRKGDMGAAFKEIGLEFHPAKNGKRRRPPSIDPKVISSRWLEVQYGVLPLMADIEGAMQMLAQAHLREKPTKVSSRSTFTHDRNETSLAGPTGGLKKTTVYKERHEVKISVSFHQQNELSHLAAQFGLSNIPLLAWELTTLSFVADWFVNIGDRLAAMDAISGMVFDSGSVSTSSRLQATSFTSPNGPGSGFFRDYQGSCFASRDDYALSRDRLISFPVPELRTKNPFSPVHVANALALLGSSMKIR